MEAHSVRYALKLLMKFFYVLPLMVCSFTLRSQSLEGAWHWEGENAEGLDIQAVVIFMSGFQVATWYGMDGRFIETNGGTYAFDGQTVTEVTEFHSSDSSRVGKETSFEVSLSDNELLIPALDMSWKRIDDGSPGKLSGPWLFSGREQDGEIQRRDTNRPRKTMKLLSGTRFQWIAYNTATKEFSGTGGGTYKTEDGKYVEQIEFFSRDDSRVGASLEFDYKIKDGEWHHSGKSSRGDPMYEIWVRRKK